MSTSTSGWFFTASDISLYTRMEEGGGGEEEGGREGGGGHL